MLVWRLIEGGVHSRLALSQKRTLLHENFFFISKTKQVYNLITKLRCTHYLLHANQASGRVHRLLQRHTQWILFFL